MLSSHQAQPVWTPHKFHSSTPFQSQPKSKNPKSKFLKISKSAKKGRKVANSEAVLLQKLNIRPFEFGMEVKFVYDDGSILTPEVFKMSPDDILAKFRKGG